MDWHYLGHAGWLVELGSQRLLFDPLSTNEHHGGVFQLDPLRKLELEALAPDFIVVSHRHADHFDVPTLHALAKLDPESVVFTADELVARTAKRVGFHTVAQVETLSRIDLDGVRLASTPSHHENEVEWGMIVESDEGVVWNQIDSYHPQPDQVKETLAHASKIFDRDLTHGMALALVRWQPVLETHAPLAESPGFPFEEYALSLARIAAIQAKAVVPSAAGVVQTAPYAFMNQYVYPVPLRRVMRDLRARVPQTAVFPPTVGATWRVRGGVCVMDPTGAAKYVTVTKTADPRESMFRPFEMPALHDANVSGRVESSMRERVERWIMRELAQGLVQAHASMGVAHALRFAVEVVFPTVTDGYTIEFDAVSARVERTIDDDYDALNAIAGSLLVDVIDGHRQWGDPLLSGMYRACVRVYDVNTEGLLPATVLSTFLYFGLPYLESVERATEHQLKLLGV